MNSPATIILLAYNQAAYIEEAVDSIFNQVYPNLQVILSDDNSTDRTFEIINEKVKKYKGQHSVVVNQTEGGKGIFHHLSNAFAKATGELIVIAGGDDVSYPTRVAELMDAWSGSGAAAISSSWRRIDSAGLDVGRGDVDSTKDIRVDAYFSGRGLPITAGATSAYSAEFLRSVPKPIIPIWAEDRFLSLVALAKNEDILSIDRDLVGYRQSQDSLSNVSTITDVKLLNHRNKFYYGQMVKLLDEFVRIHALYRLQVGIDRTAVSRDQAWYEARASWSDLSVVQRIRAMMRQSAADRFRWGFPRILGDRPLIYFKALLGRV